MSNKKKRKRPRLSAVEIAYSLRGEFTGLGDLIHLAIDEETHLADLSEEEVVSLVFSLVCDPVAVAFYLNLAEHAIFLAGATLSGAPRSPQPPGVTMVLREPIATEAGRWERGTQVQILGDTADQSLVIVEIHRPGGVPHRRTLPRGVVEAMAEVGR